MEILSKRLFTHNFLLTVTVERGGGGRNTAKEAVYKINVPLTVSKWGGGGDVG